MAEPALRSNVTELPSRRAPVEAAIVALRPSQWVKNLLRFAGIIFAAQLADPDRWLEASFAFVAYCAASSAAYLLNDIRDAAADRRHPVKRRRPIARGEVRPTTALVLACTLASAAVAVAAGLGIPSLACLLGFAVLQGAY